MVCIYSQTYNLSVENDNHIQWIEEGYEVKSGCGKEIELFRVLLYGYHGETCF